MSTQQAVLLVPVGFNILGSTSLSYIYHRNFYSLRQAALVREFPFKKYYVNVPVRTCFSFFLVALQPLASRSPPQALVEAAAYINFSRPYQGTVFGTELCDSPPPRERDRQEEESISDRRRSCAPLLRGGRFSDLFGRGQAALLSLSVPRGARPR